MRKLINFIFTFPIKVYQWVLSPFLGANCRHTPTCSAYTIQAIEEWGPLYGLWLGMKRLSKCHPWGTEGHDPVPKNPKRRP